jgi:flavin-dependent dehydrogenase
LFIRRGVAALKRWGLLDRLASTGCPPITSYSFDFGPIKIVGSLQPYEGVSRAYCPRRTVLDYLLVEAAVAAGAELRERFSVEEIMIKDGCVTGVRGHTAGHDDHGTGSSRGWRRREAFVGRERGPGAAV